MADVFVPLAVLPALSVPDVAVTDGSPDPVWVDMPLSTGYRYGRTRVVRLPFDARAAAVARRRLRADRFDRAVLTPLSLVLILLGLVMPHLVEGPPMVWWFLPYALGVAVQLGTAGVLKRWSVAQQPELIGRLGVHLPGLPAEVAQRWVRDNAGVQVVTHRPRWRRFPSRAYRWASASCALAGVAVWWFGLRDGEFGVLTLLAFPALLIGALVLLVKALPIGFVRLDEPG
jgi:hypothetical protein